jgi:prepilin-type N-terminal cleavage/methylation domain-containing protein
MKKEAREGHSHGATQGRNSSLRGSVAPSLRPSSRRAFTLAEIIVAIVITAFLAGATTLAISQAARARDASAARVEAHLRAETAASRIADDVQNTVRDAEVFFTRILLTNRADRDELLIYMRSQKLVRPRAEQGEGGEYECQYRLEPLPPGVGPRNLSRGPEAPLLALWRRVDPVPDETPDGGGIAAAIVTGVTSLSITAYDGSSWFESWDSDSSGYPHAVSITAVATDDSGRYSATARRIIALDRTPLPEVPVVVEEDDGTTPQQP